MRPKILILAGDGINCERDTARAFALAGGESVVKHVNDVLAAPQSLKEYQALALPGGFSFGDDLGSGQILALKLNHGLGDALKDFIADKKPVIGICNGFQALAKLGLLPEPYAKRVMALGRNTQGQFIDRWVGVDVEPSSRCIWTRRLAKLATAGGDPMELPIRHGEGRVVLAAGEEERIHRELTEAGQIPLRYSSNINGSYGRIAGVCDHSGIIFGLMPHPEAAISKLQYPRSTALAGQGIDPMDKGLGSLVFQDCIDYLAGK